ncbi:hypothetical protein [Chromobacterium subtsugae]|uniref:hypothetical protein n=1 Tax=Chromobacterium subtsugae TaxID=251747 RepID=UPI000AC4C63A|nr:hypothetical protein [Chromobacterium subtsugae]
MMTDGTDATKITPTSLAQVREIVTALNRVDLARAEYEYLLNQIGLLIKGIPLLAHPVPIGTVIHRGVCYTEKPTQVSFLGAPPAEKVTGYQRCNSPGNPLFYCSLDTNAILSELDVQVGQTLYLSKWTVREEFFHIRIPPDATPDVQASPTYSKVETFFETRFSQRVHETFSEQYKLTAAIAERLSGGELIGDGSLIQGRRWGAVVYPSVAHIGRSDNLAIRPSIVEACLELNGVYEYQVIDRDEKSWSTQNTDYSANFENGSIVWAGRPPQWVLAPGEQLRVQVENNQWVARRPDGTIVHPS